MALYWLAEPLLYVCYAILAGWLILIRTAPGFQVPSKIVAGAAIGIGLFGIFPILRIVMFFAEDLGLGLTVQNVLFRFDEGKAFLWTVLIVLCLCFIIRIAKPESNRKAWILCLLLLVAMMGAQGWSSHATSFYGTLGFVPQTLHLYAVSLWSGTLLLAGQYLPIERWKSFLTWFHPTAMLAMTVIVGSGFMLTVLAAPEYVNSWVLPYGQALLLKHLLWIPLIVFAVFNGWWVKRKLSRQASFNPKPWAQAEGIFILLIYIVTGFMNQQAAPHDVSETLKESPASLLYIWLHGELTERTESFHFGFEPISIVCGGVALLNLIYLMIRTPKELRPLSAITAGLLFVTFAFVSAITAIT